jgi:hypothetical protein
LESKDMGSRSFQGQNSLLGDSGAILEFLEWLEGLATKDRGSCDFLGILRDFLWNFGEFKVV